MSLHNPDLTTATRIAQAINAYLGGSIAVASDPSNVELRVPANYTGGAMGLLTDIEQVKVDPDQSAKVIIDQTSGVIVMGADVRISTVAIAQGNLTIKVQETPQVSQPSPFSNTGTTEVVPRTQIQIDDSKGNKMAVAASRRVAAKRGGWAECAGCGSARHHLHSAGDQSGGRAAGRYSGDRLMDAAVQSAMTLAQSAPVKAPQPTANAAAATKAAKEFESVFISQFLGSMFSGIPTDGMFGGGQGEEMFRSMMVDEYGKSMEQRGGFGLASAVTRQLLKHQEAPQQASVQ